MDWLLQRLQDFRVTHRLIVLILLPLLTFGYFSFELISVVSGLSKDNAYTVEVAENELLETDTTVQSR